MSKELTIKIHEIATDGLPDMDKLFNRVAFLWDGGLIDGWPAEPSDTESIWVGAEDRYFGPYCGVTHWVEFPEKLSALDRKEKN